jgi:hypothetical protein
VAIYPYIERKVYNPTTSSIVYSLQRSRIQKFKFLLCTHIFPHIFEFSISQTHCIQRQRERVRKSIQSNHLIHRTLSSKIPNSKIQIFTLHTYSHTFLNFQFLKHIVHRETERERERLYNPTTSSILYFLQRSRIQKFKFYFAHILPHLNFQFLTHIVYRERERAASIERKSIQSNHLIHRIL